MAKLCRAYNTAVALEVRDTNTLAATTLPPATGSARRNSIAVAVLEVSPHYENVAAEEMREHLLGVEAVSMSTTTLTCGHDLADPPEYVDVFPNWLLNNHRL